MRSRSLLLGLLAAAAALPAASAAQAQSGPTYQFHESRGQLILTVRPKSWLDAGRVVQPGSLDNPATSPRYQLASYYNLPPNMFNRERFFGTGILPDPIQNGPFVGARTPFDPVEFGPFSGRRY